jgi:hypothetical protein
MKVKELVEILLKLDQEKEIGIFNYEYGGTDAIDRIDEDINMANAYSILTK